MQILPIVIVACLRDEARLQTLLASLEKFSVETRQIHVVSGDLDFDTFAKAWHCRLRPTAARHCYWLHPAHELATITSTVGWRRQQVLKLLAYKLLDGDWLTMDCSNLVTRPWSNSDLSINGQWVTTGDSPDNLGNHAFIDAIRYYMAWFDCRPTMVESCCTPFVLEAGVVGQLIERFNGESRFVEWFVSSDFNPSEYCLHSIFSQSLRPFNRCRRRTGFYVWQPGGCTADQLRAAFDNDRYKTITVHRAALEDHNLRLAYDQCVANLNL